MSQLIWKEAKTIRRKIKDAIRIAHDHNIDVDIDTIRERVMDTEREEFREVLKIATILHEDYMAVTGKCTKQCYFVTVRPRPGVTWNDFYTSVYKWITRKCIKEYYLSFEQKDVNGSGEGFHVHMVCHTSHRSKGECLRDAISTFNCVADANCIDVRPTREPSKIVNNYLVNYESDDNHKIVTKQGDTIWRTKMNLKDLYNNDKEPLLSLSSPVGTAIMGYTHSPTIVTFTE